MAGGKRLRPVLAVAGRRAPTRRRHRRGRARRRRRASWSTSARSTTTTSWTRPTPAARVESVNARWGNLRPSSPATSCWPGRRRSPPRSAPRWPGCWPAPSGGCARARSPSCATPSTSAAPLDAYLESIDGKTASLFATACRIGGIVADLPARAHRRPHRLRATRFGMVFQIVDDVLDLTATEAAARQAGRPRPGRGHLHAAGDPARWRPAGTAAEELGDLLGRPLDGAEVDKALAIVRSNGGVDEAAGRRPRLRRRRRAGPFAARSVAGPLRRWSAAPTTCSPAWADRSGRERRRGGQARQRRPLDLGAGEGVAGQHQRGVGVLDDVARVRPLGLRRGEPPALHLRGDDRRSAQPRLQQLAATPSPWPRDRRPSGRLTSRRWRGA